MVVKPLPDEWQTSEYDLGIATIGFEARARFVWQSIAPSARVRAACGFQSNQVLEYGKNSEWFKNNGFSIDHSKDDDYSAWLKSKLCEARPNKRLKIIADISSVSRPRMAQLLQTLSETNPKCTIELDIVYSLASYDAPSENPEANVHVGPVIPSFAGWWEEPERGLVAVVGLGYEEDKALGATEHLQADDIWVFSPESGIPEYAVAVKEANRTLLESVRSTQILTYQVGDPYLCFVTLESLIFGLSKRSNPVILPLGPKPFALCALLVGIVDPRVAVWRVSAASLEQPINRRPAGQIFGLHITFQPGRDGITAPFFPVPDLADHP